MRHNSSRKTVKQTVFSMGSDGTATHRSTIIGLVEKRERMQEIILPSISEAWEELPAFTWNGS